MNSKAANEKESSARSANRLVKAQGEERLSAIRALIAALENGPDSGVIDALENMGELAVEPLIKALSVTKVRRGAAETLGRIGDKRAVTPLIKGLRAKDIEYQVAAAEALGELRDPRAVEPLIDRLKARDSYVRYMVLDALARFKDSRAAVPVTLAAVRAVQKSETDVALVAALPICQLAPAVNAYLISGLNNPDWETRMKTASYLCCLCEIQDFIRSNQEGMEEGDIYAINTWCPVDSAEDYYNALRPSLIKLIKLFSDPDLGIWAYAAEGGDMMLEEVLKPLRKAAADDWDDNVRSKAAEALDKLGEIFKTLGYEESGE